MIKTIARGITYIGASDEKEGLFEGQYITPEGMAYNSYLAEGAKIAVIDTADAVVAEQWKANLAEALRGRTPDYLVVHHVEPDHSAMIAWALDSFPGIKVVASAKALQMLPNFFEGRDFSSAGIAVKEGDTLDLGNGVSLRFFGAAMVHWPEVMVSYEASTGCLFSADAFGKFGALPRCGFFGEEDNDWACEARRYYFNIVGKYGIPVQGLLRKLATVDIRTICPLHGPILRDELDEYLRLYGIWSSYGVETEGVFVAYSSMHGGTEEAALKLADILRAKGCPKVATANLCKDDMAEAVEDAFRYGKMVLAAPTYDGGLFTPAYNFLHTLQMKGYQQRTVGLIENGSWAPAAAKVMTEMLSAMKAVSVLPEVVTIKSCLHADDIPALEALADAILKEEA